MSHDDSSHECHDEHVLIVNRLEAIAAESDGRLRDIAADQEQIRETVTVHVHPEIEELAEHMIGPRLSVLAGGGRDTSQGIEGRLLILEEGQLQIADILSNGGLRTRLGYRDRIYVALIGATALLGSAVITALVGVAR